MQSITAPLQGFLNAVVYGWTREDFLYIMAVTSKDQDAEREMEGELENSGVSSEVENCREDSEIHASIIVTSESDEEYINSF